MVITDQSYHVGPGASWRLHVRGDKMLAEKLYADVSPLVPFIPWLIDA
ncbi:MAG: hypothetical protein ABIQ09_00105 [Jatrophihabitantaceae bacterium]